MSPPHRGQKLIGWMVPLRDTAFKGRVLINRVSDSGATTSALDRFVQPISRNACI
jgi:hypothetical protein